MKKGKFIVIEGTDGSGKGTQVKLLLERLRKFDLEVSTTDFPQYGEPSAFFVEKYLRGDYGTVDEVGPKLASYFYALDRFDKSFDIRKLLDQGSNLISNRYTTSSMGHQAGKITSRKEQDIFLDWLDDLEYEQFNIPRPDLVIFLSVPSEIGQQLVSKKEEREYTKGKSHDIHEADLSHLEKAHDAYHYVADKFGWVKIDCMDGDRLMTIEEVHNLILEEVSKILCVF